MAYMTTQDRGADFTGARRCDVTADEYEARLRDAARDSWSDLDAYADWLRLQALAKDGHRCRWGACKACDAEKRMAEILAAAEVTA